MANRPTRRSAASQFEQPLEETNTDLTTTPADGPAITTKAAAGSVPARSEAPRSKPAARARGTQAKGKSKVQTYTPDDLVEKPKPAKAAKGAAKAAKGATVTYMPDELPDVPDDTPMPAPELNVKPDRESFELRRLYIRPIKQPDPRKVLERSKVCHKHMPKEDWIAHYDPRKEFVHRTALEKYTEQERDALLVADGNRLRDPLALNDVAKDKAPPAEMLAAALARGADGD